MRAPGRRISRMLVYVVDGITKHEDQSTETLVGLDRKVVTRGVPRTLIRRGRSVRPSRDVRFLIDLFEPDTETCGEMLLGRPAMASLDCINSQRSWQIFLRRGVETASGRRRQRVLDWVKRVTNVLSVVCDLRFAVCGSP